MKYLAVSRIGGLPGFSVELDQRRLDLQVAVDPVDLTLRYRRSAR